MMDKLLQDIRYALRLWRREPGLRVRRHPHAGARRRRQHRDVQHRQRRAAAAAAVPRRRPHRVGVGKDERVSARPPDLSRVRLWTSLRPSGVTASTPTSAPLMCARRIASRNSGSSAASIVICVKNTVSSGNCASASIRSNRSARIASRRSSCAVILAPRGHPQIVERDGIEVVVGERDEAEAAPPQLHDLVEHAIHLTRPRTLAIGPPDRAERAVLRAAAHRLHRGPHVTSGRQQIPPRQRGTSRLRFDHRRRVAAERRPRSRASTSGHTRSPSPVTTACAPPSSRASSGYSVAWMPPYTTYAPAARAAIPIS